MGRAIVCGLGFGLANAACRVFSVACSSQPTTAQQPVKSSAGPSGPISRHQTRKPVAQFRVVTHKTLRGPDSGPGQPIPFMLPNRFRRGSALRPLLACGCHPIPCPVRTSQNDKACGLLRGQKRAEDRIAERRPIHQTRCCCHPRLCTSRATFALVDLTFWRRRPGNHYQAQAKHYHWAPVAHAARGRGGRRCSRPGVAGRLVRGVCEQRNSGRGDLVDEKSLLKAERKAKRACA
jgi:hypothetical protein